MSVSGFTIVRNAEILDYPFEESVLSALPLCDEFVINCGDSDDATLGLCESLRKRFPDKIRLVCSSWEREGQLGGFQLKHQTDRAFAECRGDWSLYLQADEVLHEADYEKIRGALADASLREDVDGILFDYVHFYSNYSYSITGRNWYRAEVRLIKKGRGIESFRDAQGFRRNGKRLRALASDARVFHYGYVRSIELMARKAEQMSQWWGEPARTRPEDLQPKRHVGLQPFTGTHPAVMQGRVSRNAHYFDPSQAERKWDWNEIKNAVTLVWESLFHYRLGEFRNYDRI